MKWMGQGRDESDSSVVGSREREKKRDGQMTNIRILK